MSIGRPSSFNQSISDEICLAISTSTESIKKLCSKHEHWPSHETINKWRILHPIFADQYACAKQIQADLLVEQVLDTARNTANDTITDADGNVHANHAAVQRDRLIIAKRFTNVKSL